MADDRKALQARRSKDLQSILSTLTRVAESRGKGLICPAIRAKRTGRHSHPRSWDYNASTPRRVLGFWDAPPRTPSSLYFREHVKVKLDLPLASRRRVDETSPKRVTTLENMSWNLLGAPCTWLLQNRGERWQTNRSQEILTRCR